MIECKAMKKNVFAACVTLVGQLLVLAGGTPEVPGGASIRGKDGGIWPDNNGVHVNAHGGCVLAYGGRYWWYGEH